MSTPPHEIHISPEEPKIDKIVVEETDEEKAKREELEFESELCREIPRIYVTPALIALNVLVYAAMCLRGVDFLEPDVVSLVRWGADYGPFTIGLHQWWRVVTSIFVHAGLIHIGLNMLALWTTGHIVERLYGARAFLLLYMVCGIGASLVSLWHHPGIPSVGASGAIVGVYGCLLAFMMHPNPVLSKSARNIEVKSLLGFFAYLLVAALRSPEIDNTAHIGGAVLGFIMGWIYPALLEPRLPHPVPPISAGKRSGAKSQGAAVHEAE